MRWVLPMGPADGSCRWVLPVGHKGIMLLPMARFSSNGFYIENIENL
jgi:hypothetical protein